MFYYSLLVNFLHHSSETKIIVQAVKCHQKNNSQHESNQRVDCLFSKVLLLLTFRRQLIFTECSAEWEAHWKREISVQDSFSLSLVEQ